MARNRPARFARAGIRAALALALGAALALPAPALAALPMAVDGQQLPSLAPMLERVTPAVVNISAQDEPDPQARMAGGGRQNVGSGVIVDAAQGNILTNHHVVRGASAIRVSLQDGRSFSAKVVGSDPDTDLAVLRIPAENLQALALSDSSDLRVGDFVVAIGDPFGLGQSASSGIVSALDRSNLRAAGYQNFIQTDASINPGNSGGALVNLNGELVGINTMIYTPSGGNVGIGFAIPSNLAAEVMRQLLQHGQVQRGGLGLTRWTSRRATPGNWVWRRAPVAWRWRAWPTVRRRSRPVCRRATRSWRWTASRFPPAPSYATPRACCRWASRCA